MPDSDSEDGRGVRPMPNLEDAAKANPKVDVEKAREAQILLEELRKQGLSRRGYDIASPYERRPLRSHRGKEQAGRPDPAGH